MVQPGSHLGKGVWLRRLLDGVASRCVRTSRRDPRESAATEQTVYEQLIGMLDQGRPRVVRLHVQGAGWFANLMLQADELAGVVAPLLRQFAADLESVFATAETLGRLACVVVTHSAAGLPGLVATVKVRPLARSSLLARPVEEGDDYGDLLVNTPSDLVHVLPIDALAATAFELAARTHRGEFRGPPRRRRGWAGPGARARRTPGRRAVVPRPRPPAAGDVVHAVPRPGVRPGVRKRAVPARLRPALRDRLRPAARTCCTTAAGTGRW